MDSRARSATRRPSSRVRPPQLLHADDKVRLVQACSKLCWGAASSNALAWGATGRCCPGSTRAGTSCCRSSASGRTAGGEWAGGTLVAAVGVGCVSRPFCRRAFVLAVWSRSECARPHQGFFWRHPRLGEPAGVAFLCAGWHNGARAPQLPHAVRFNIVIPVRHRPRAVVLAADGG